MNFLIKTELTYTRMLQAINIGAVQLNLFFVSAAIHIDFEMLVTNAIRKECHLEPTGRLFHCP